MAWDWISEREFETLLAPTAGSGARAIVATGDTFEILTDHDEHVQIEGQCTECDRGDCRHCDMLHGACAVDGFCGECGSLPVDLDTNNGIQQQYCASCGTARDETQSIRPFRPSERKILDPILSQTDIPVRVVEGDIEAADGELLLHAEAVGWRPGHRRIDLASNALDELNDDQLIGLLAHEIGHHKGFHPLIGKLMRLIVAPIATAVFLLPAWMAISTGVLGWVTLQVILLAVGFILLTFGSSWTSRRMELDADRRGADMLDTIQPLEALYSAESNDKASTNAGWIAEKMFPWPDDDERLAALRE